jgi:hypothetical protein
VRAGALGLIGCAGLAYSANIALRTPQVIPSAERQPLWYACLPILAYSCLLVSAVAFAADARLADEVGAIASVILSAPHQLDGHAGGAGSAEIRVKIACGSFTGTGRSRSRRAS